MKIYLASSWRNPYHAEVLADLRAAGHDVYDFKNPKPGNTGFGWRQTIARPIVTGEDLLEALAHPRAQEGFDLDFGAMRWADVCVLLLPCGNSAHLEAGWFAGKGKPVAVLCRELREPELMYKCFDRPVQETPLFMSAAALLEHLDSLPTATCHLAPDGAWNGPGWYYVDDEYPEEGVFGVFASQDDAREAARRDGYIVIDPPTTPSSRDDGEREPTVVLCCVRLGHGSWCYLPDGHEGDHEGAAPFYGPIEERPPLWRRHKGFTR